MKLCPIDVHCISYDRKFAFFKFKVAWNSALLITDFSLKENQENKKYVVKDE